MEKEIINYFLERRYEVYRGQEIASMLQDMMKPKRRTLDTSMISSSDVDQLLSIIESIEKTTGLHFDQFNVKSKKGELAKFRFVFMYIVKTTMGLTLAQVGKLMGGRDHSTVIHGIKEVENWLGNTTFYKRENKLIDDIRRNLATGPEGQE